MAEVADSDKKKKIIVHSHKDGFVVDVELFEKYSEKIKKLKQQGKVPKVLDLSHYDVTAVATLYEFMVTCGQTKARITTFILGDLMELARVLEMQALRDKIEEFVVSSAAHSLHFLLHALTMISKDKGLLETPLGNKVIDIAVKDFQRIVKSPQFTEIPLDSIIRIFDRCDLAIETEFDVAEAAMAWLAAKSERVHVAYMVLRCVRIGNLTFEQRVDLASLISNMPHYKRTVSAFAFYAFNNCNTFRVCVLTEHASFKRCGNKKGLNDFVISVPAHHIVIRRQIPVKSSYITAKPRAGKSPGVSDKSDMAVSDAEDLKHCVFSVTQEHRTTRTERMAAYREQDRQRDEKLRLHQHHPAHKSASTTSGSKSKEHVKPKPPQQIASSSGNVVSMSCEALKKSREKPDDSEVKKKSRNMSRKSAGSSPSEYDEESSYFSTTSSGTSASSGSDDSAQTCNSSSSNHRNDTDNLDGGPLIHLDTNNNVNS